MIMKWRLRWERGWKLDSCTFAHLSGERVELVGGLMELMDTRLGGHRSSPPLEHRLGGEGALAHRREGVAGWGLNGADGCLGLEEKCGAGPVPMILCAGGLFGDGGADMKWCFD